MARSSAKVEYRFMDVSVCDLKCLKQVFCSLCVFHRKPMRLFYFSQTALYITKNLIFYDRTKHVKMDCHFIRDEMVSCNVSTSYISTY